MAKGGGGYYTKEGKYVEPYGFSDKTWLSPEEYHAKKEALKEAKRIARKRLNERCRRVARAWFENGGTCESIAEYLNANLRPGEKPYNAKGIEKYRGKAETRQYYVQLQRQADNLVVHNRVEVISKLVDILHYDRRNFYNETITYVPVFDEEGNHKVGDDGKLEYRRQVCLDMKPMSEWPDEAVSVFEGLDWKTQKGRDPLPVIKLVDKMATIEKLGKDLKMWVERHSVEDPDGSPLGTSIARLPVSVREKMDEMYESERGQRLLPGDDR